MSYKFTAINDYVNVKLDIIIMIESDRFILTYLCRVHLEEFLYV